MTEYTFKYGPFYFKIHGETDRDAVNKARRALEESFPKDSINHLNVELTAGAFNGRLYLEPQELSARNICKQETLPELEVGVPF